jgi:hypothetical protein
MIIVLGGMSRFNNDEEKTSKEVDPNKIKASP